jgi:hypothetical protein
MDTVLKRHSLDPVDILFCGIFVIKNFDKQSTYWATWAKTIVVDIKDKEQFLLNDTAIV